MKLQQIVFAASLACVVSVASAGSYTSPGAAIPDNSPTAPLIVTFNVTEVGALSTLSLTMSSLTHTWSGDLIATLTAPNGTTADLLRRSSVSLTSTVGSSADFNGNYRFIDSGADLVPSLGLTAIPAGDYKASTRTVATTATSSILLNPIFANVPLFGVWTLAVSDNATLDTGSLGSATLTVTAVPEPGTYLMFALGLAGVATLRRLRQSRP